MRISPGYNKESKETQDLTCQYLGSFKAFQKWLTLRLSWKLSSFILYIFQSSILALDV